MDNQQMGMGGGVGMGVGAPEARAHHKWHWLHVVMGYKAKFLVCLSAISLICAWVATFRGTVLGLIAPHWFWDSLILGLLSLCVQVVWARHEDKC